jgi:hypothetical protein
MPSENPPGLSALEVIQYETAVAQKEAAEQTHLNAVEAGRRQKELHRAQMAKLQPPPMGDSTEKPDGDAL